MFRLGGEATVGELLAGEKLECRLTAPIASEAGFTHDLESAQDVVVPVEWVVELHEFRANRRTIRSPLEELTLEKDGGRALDGFANGGVSRVPRVRRESAHRRQRFHERR